MHSASKRTRRIPEAIYILCFLTSGLVAFLLFRGYRRTGGRLLLWCGLGFAGLCLNNFLLIVDAFLGATADLSLVRNIPALLGVCLVVYGLVWESD
jgi:hypothetical protein